MRITNNEEQIMNISRAMNKDYEKIPAINENLFNLSLKKDSKLIEQKEDKVTFKEKTNESHFPAFHQAP